MKSDDNVLGKGIEAIFKKTAHLRDGDEKTLELPNGTIRRLGKEVLIRLVMDDQWDIRGAIEELCAAARSGMLDQLADEEKMKSNLEDHMEMAAIAIEDRDFKAAEEELLEALKIRDIPNVRFNLALVYEELRKKDKAIAQYRKLIKTSPKFAHALNNLGLLYYAKGDFSKAMELYEKAVKCDPSLSEQTAGGDLLAPRSGFKKMKA